MFNFFAMSTPLDATVLLSYIKKISDRYELDYCEVATFCGLPVTPRLKVPTPSKSLEYIIIEGTSYLYDHNTNAVYNEKVQYVGQLSTDTYKVIV